MKTKVTKAIVLTRVNFGEADRIVTFLTEDQGRITVIAKGARRLKSKLAAGIEPFSVNEITYIPGKKDISTLVSAKMVEHFSTVIKGLDKSEIAFECLKWLKENIEADVDEDYYGVTVIMFRLLAITDERFELAYIYFFCNVAAFSGQAIDPLHDDSGGKLASAESYGFDYDKGVFIPDSSGIYKQSDIKVLRLVYGGTVDVLSRLQIDESRLQVLKSLIHQHRLLIS